MALKLSVKPGEKFVVNGAVIANGDRRASLIVHNKCSILREKDIMQEGDASTPLRRVYFTIMMMYISEETIKTHYEDFVVRMSEFMGCISDPEATLACVEISKNVMNKEYYKALMLVKKLLPFEEERLSYVPAGLPEDTEHHPESP